MNAATGVTAVPDKLYRGVASLEDPLNEHPIWFADCPVVASEYAEQAVFDNSDIELPEDVESSNDLGLSGIRYIAKEEGLELSGVVLSARVRMEHMLDLTEFGSNLNDVEKIWRWFEARNLVPAGETWDELDEVVKIELADSHNGFGLWRFLEDEGFYDQAARAGYDGFMIEDIGLDGVPHLAWAVVSPDQVEILPERKAAPAP